MTRNFVSESTSQPNSKPGDLSFAAHLKELAQGIRERNAALLILDPLLPRLDGRLDTHKFSDVERALDALAAAARLPWMRPFSG